MAYSVEMLELGESVTEGTITQWLKSVGDTVEADEPLLEVSTDKVDTEIPSPVSGTLLEIKAEEDDTIDVGSVIAIIGDEDESAGSSDSSDSDDSEESSSQEEESDSAEESSSSDSDDSASAASGDATDVEMPELGESVTEGTITQWLKSVGDTVEVDEPLLEVSTDKEIGRASCREAGTLVEILADADDTIDGGSAIARIGDETAKPASDDKKDEPKEEPKKEEESESAEESSSSDSDDSASAASGDATDVEMPELGESVTEGTITQWLKSVGDTVEVDEPLLEVSTDKVDTEIPSPVAGTLVEILADEDDTIDVGSVIARIGDENAKPASDDKKDEPKEEPKKEESKKEAPKKEKPKAEPKKEQPKKEAPKKEAAEKAEKSAPKSSSKVNSGDNVPYVTPLVRKLADKHGIDLNTVEGTGVGGRIRK